MVSVLLLDLPDGSRHRIEQASVPFGRLPTRGLTLTGIDSGPAPMTMSRHAGTFVFKNGEWWVENAGAAYLDLISEELDGVVSVPRSTAARLPRIGTIEIPPVGYRLRFRAPEQTTPDRVASIGPRTTRLVDLTPRHVDFLVALAEPELTDSPAAVRRTLGDVARIWSVQPITVERALRTIRDRMTDAGLLNSDGRGGPGISDVVARVAVKSGAIDLGDYRWAALNGPGGPRPAAAGPRFTRPQ